MTRRAKQYEHTRCSSDAATTHSGGQRVGRRIGGKDVGRVMEVCGRGMGEAKAPCLLPLPVRDSLTGQYGSGSKMFVYSADSAKQLQSDCRCACARALVKAGAETMASYSTLRLITYRNDQLPDE